MNILYFKYYFSYKSRMKAVFISYFSNNIIWCINYEQSSTHLHDFFHQLYNPIKQLKQVTKVSFLTKKVQNIPLQPFVFFKNPIFHK
jgi:hypothetical protein